MKMTPLAYIIQELKGGKFTAEWTALNDQDRATMKQRAAEEMAALGIEVQQ